MSKFRTIKEKKSSNNILDLYWQEIKDNQPLKRREESEIFVLIRQGDEEALEKLINANLRFVVRVAREYCPQDGPLLMDLIAEGNMGLIKAVHKFDETRGFKFITYAVWWIRQAILKALPRDFRAARLPMSHIHDLHAVEKGMAVLSQDLGRKPTLFEIADQMEMTPDRLRNAMAADQRDMSFDAPLFEDEGTPTIEAFAVVGNDDNGMDQQMERMMRMHNPDFKGMPKVLEVNAKHPLIKSLNAKLEAGEFEGSDDFAKLILDSALVAEGEAINDSRDFAKRLSDVMQKALAN